jgi:hypothetical protein
LRRDDSVARNVHDLHDCDVKLQKKVTERHDRLAFCAPGADMVGRIVPAGPFAVGSLQ